MKRIKKIKRITPATANIINGASESNRDAYSSQFSDARFLKKNIQEKEYGSSTTVYIPFEDSDSNELVKNEGLRCITREGTSSQTGYGIFIAGNDIPSGTAGNKTGYLRLFNNAGYYMQLYYTNSGSTNRNIILPNYAGTMQLAPVDLYNNSTGTNGTVTVSQDPHNFAKVKIYWRWGTSDSAYRGCTELQMNTDAQYSTPQFATVVWSSTTSVNVDTYTCNLYITSSGIQHISSGNNLTRTARIRQNATTSTAAGTVNATSTDNFYITKVEGLYA